MSLTLIRAKSELQLARQIRISARKGDVVRRFARVCGSPAVECRVRRCPAHGSPSWLSRHLLRGWHTRGGRRIFLGKVANCKCGVAYVAGAIENLEWGLLPRKQKHSSFMMKFASCRPRTNWGRLGIDAGASGRCGQRSLALTFSLSSRQMVLRGRTSRACPPFSKE